MVSSAAQPVRVPHPFASPSPLARLAGISLTWTASSASLSSLNETTAWRTYRKRHRHRRRQPEGAMPD
eukprot:9480024-Pyramimonas_sp.AAC.1